MKDIIERRRKVSNFLIKVIKSVEEIVKEDNGKFDFSSYVSSYKVRRKNICGTVCCIQRWFPKIFPETFKWKQKGCCSIGIFFKNNIEFENPIQLNIPISDRLWGELTVPGICSLQEDSTFQEVKEYWKIIIKEIKKGNLDDQLH